MAFHTIHKLLPSAAPPRAKQSPWTSRRPPIKVYKKYELGLKTPKHIYVCSFFLGFLMHKRYMIFTCKLFLSIFTFAFHYNTIHKILGPAISLLSKPLYQMQPYVSFSSSSFSSYFLFLVEIVHEPKYNFFFLINNP